MYGFRLATADPQWPRPALAITNRTENKEPATRSHPHPSPSQTGSRAAEPPPRLGRNFEGDTKILEILMDQRDLASPSRTSRHVSRRNDSATRLAKLGKIRGICSMDVPAPLRTSVTSN